jgi:hypothetical protein
MASPMRTVLIVKYLDYARAGAELVLTRTSRVSCLAHADGATWRSTQERIVSVAGRRVSPRNFQLATSIAITFLTDLVSGIWF